MKIIKRGGFREKASRQIRYRDSVNHQAIVPAHHSYMPEDERNNPPSSQSSSEVLLNPEKQPTNQS